MTSDRESFAQKVIRSTIKQLLATQPTQAAELLKLFDAYVEVRDEMQTEAYAKAVEEKFKR